MASDSARRRKKAGMGSELGSGAAAENAGPAYTAALDAAGADTILFVGTTAGACGPIRPVEQRTRWSTAAASATGGTAKTGAGAGAGGSSPRLRIRTSSMTSRCLDFSLVGDGCFRDEAAGLAGGERRPGATGALAGVTAFCTAAGFVEAMGAAALAGGEDAAAGLGLRRRRGFAGDGVYASRCIRLLSASWDLRTAVAMAAGSVSLLKEDSRGRGCCLANPKRREGNRGAGAEGERDGESKRETGRTGRGGAGYMDRSGRGGVALRAWLEFFFFCFIYYFHMMMMMMMRKGNRFFFLRLGRRAATCERDLFWFVRGGEGSRRMRRDGPAADAVPDAFGVGPASGTARLC